MNKSNSVSTMTQSTATDTKASRQVPHLSFQSYTDGTTDEKQAFVNSLIAGLKDYGFIVLSDHPVYQTYVDEAYKLVHQFFELPEATKLAYGGIEGGQRGYTPFGKEKAKDSKHPDLKEFWHVGRTLSAESPYQGVYPDNVWPEKEVPGFTQAFSKLYNLMDNTAQVLLDAIGEGLGLEQSFFRDMTHDGNSILRTIHYPPTDGLDTVQSIRAGAHEDINLITLLVGATDSGLQLLDRDGSWLDVHSEPGELVVDSGDMMARLTGGVLPATTHRVINPDLSTSRRYSMPYFVHPHANAMLSCLASCREQGNPEPDITAGDFLRQRLIEIGLIPADKA
jgi:isopenicillin N synthase-like dioxygenase